MLYERIARLSKRKGWSIYRLTQEAELSKNYLYDLKAGRLKDVSFHNMCKIADALEVSLDAFNERR